MANRGVGVAWEVWVWLREVWAWLREVGVAFIPNFRGFFPPQAFGFLNLLLWAGGSWFIYKETPWHRPATPPDPTPAPM